MAFFGGKRGATTAPSVEKPTAMTASSAHCSKSGTPGRASRLMTNNSSPAAARTRDTAHEVQASQVAARALNQPAARSWSFVFSVTTALYTTAVF
jgi:hypothetical protein